MVLATKERIVADRTFSTERYILQTHPVLYLPLWKKDHGMSGGKMLSSDGIGHVCTVIGALQRRDGKYVEGTDDYVTTPVIDVSAGSGLTIMAWFKRVGASGGTTDNYYHCILGHINGAGGSNSIMVNSAGTELKMEVQLDNDSYASQTQVISDATIFNLVGGIWDGSNLTPFVNDVLGTPKALAGTLKAGGALTTIGYWAVGYYFANGLIGEVLVYNRAFSLVGIQNISLATKWRYK